MVTLASPYAIWVLKQASDQAARPSSTRPQIMDGATAMQLFRLVYLPLMVPTMVAIGIYAVLRRLERVPGRVPDAVDRELTHPVGRARQVPRRPTTAPWGC